MIVVYSKNKIPIRLSRERWTHMLRRHPELATEMDKVIETISDPGVILKGDFGEFLATRFYQVTPLTKKYLVVAYKELSSQDGMILTGYFTNSLSKRRQVIWKR